jgi:hypothetical protein
MHAIVSSYGSSDSDEEINPGQDAVWTEYSSQHKQCESTHNLRHEYIGSVQNVKHQHNPGHGNVLGSGSIIGSPDSQSNYSQVVEKVKLPVHGPGQRLPAVLTDDSEQTAQRHTTNQGMRNLIGTKKTDDTEKVLKPQQNFDTTTLGNCVPCSRKDNVLPYIPKAKRRKHSSEQQSTADENSSRDINPLSLVLKKEKLFSKETISCYHAPKRKLIHFVAHQKCINKISWNPCFQDLLLSASMDSVVKIWNIETKPSCVQQLSGHTQAVKDAKWNIDGLNILSGGYDKFSRITDINAGT